MTFVCPVYSVNMTTSSCLNYPRLQLYCIVVSTKNHYVVYNILESVMGWTNAKGNVVEWVHNGINLIAKISLLLAA